ncbi:dihydrofolate reductase [Algibacter amylolyticus]|uniref:dihydrofolate reductase n=1 Tax=Algibacter amylolyticus TaxID=1608400 RepID=A0A5M7BH52_9FLAO|nr:dihydrofolate reductase [Algibacter amylolyticus]KAA5826395.1 dihydrofolate reductase [Algibacter amylolyticus]MBB5268601.1 dihydrofolate reductase [Algibacter amylolyticus]TSJ80433.1 dihydrofolate reductase [Algibacter amylolyticus]
MFGKKKPIPQIDKDQLELIENAQKRIKQKKGLYAHFVIFLIGAIFLIVANTFLGIGKDFKILEIDWFVFAILIWLFLFVYHLFNVFVTNKFMGKDWEKAQLQKLVAKQQNRIEKLKAGLVKEETVLAKSEVFKEETTKRINKGSELTIIVAAAENNAIGLGNKLIWHLSDDLKRFKALTNGHHIIMGRKTFESFPKPLPNRTHVVITRQKDYNVPDGVIVVHSLEDAIDASKKDSNPYIIGGGQIYKQAMAIADKIELTRVHESFDADTYFPEIDTNVWKETANTFHTKDDTHAHEFSFLTYARK